MFTIDNETFVPAKDEDGRDYFCPVDIAGGDRTIARADTEACLEADVAGRYASVMKS